eukprot:TRINITY_DN5229_c0_g1_i1.p1 TRINITY_DN5229_c0_g1~~TRINITY_DN5229_c0_g1_i1.p1  ORF type:complete len:737 (-),score=139.10 TRINITY_DN5229_c0_g1_i1:151-2361(-)
MVSSRPIYFTGYIIFLVCIVSFPQSVKSIVSQKRTTPIAGIKINDWNYTIISWTSINKDVYFAIDQSGYLLESSNALMSFTQRTDVNMNDMVYEIASHPVLKNVVIIFGHNSDYISTDYGKSFQRVSSTFNLTSIVFHPSKSTLALALSRENLSQLYISVDTGSSWSSILNGVTQYHWDGDRIVTISTDHVPNNMYNEAYFGYSDDNGKTWLSPIPENATFFTIHQRYLTLVAEFEQSMDLYVSNNHGTSFKHALLPKGIPAGDLNPNQFLESDNGVIWIVVPEDGTVTSESSKGNLYVSDTDGYKFTLSLRGVHTVNGKWDVEYVRSVEGTMIANIVISLFPLQIKTMITYDNGDTWEFLEKPTNSNCSSASCALHIFGDTADPNKKFDINHEITTSKAVGLLIANGNVGTYLDYNSNNTNTYLSRDGGLTWDEIMKGPSIYQYGDYGGLLLLASSVNETDTIYYSLDSGLTTQSFNVDQVVLIKQIFVSSVENERFVIVGYNSTTKSYVFWGVDFSEYRERNCTDDDFELWSPHNGIKGPKCVLGHDITYRRKKRQAECFSPDGLNHIASINNCPCSQNDYECDYMFEMTVVSGKCSYQGKNLEEESKSQQCLTGVATYSISSGYRKLPGDTCDNPLTEYNPTTKPCSIAVEPVNDSSADTLQVVAIILGCLLVLVLVGVGGVCIGLRNESFRQKFNWIKAPKWVHIGYSNQLVEEELGDEYNEEDLLESDEDL